MDLLIFSEHNNFFHIVDARDYTVSQIVKAGDEDGHDISGLSFSPDCSKIFVGNMKIVVQVCLVKFETRVFFLARLLQDSNRM
jgi:hypothetical protein